MINDKNLDLMDCIMDAITDSEEWLEIQMHDPMAVDAANRFNAALEQAKDLLPREIYNKLSDVYMSGVVAAGNSGILFGLHVADVIRDVASRPADLSRHIQKRIQGHA